MRFCAPLLIYTASCWQHSSSSSSFGSFPKAPIITDDGHKLWRPQRLPANSSALAHCAAWWRHQEKKRLQSSPIISAASKPSAFPCVYMFHVTVWMMYMNVGTILLSRVKWLVQINHLGKKKQCIYYRPLVLWQQVVGPLQSLSPEDTSEPLINLTCLFLEFVRKLESTETSRPELNLKPSGQGTTVL